MQVHCLALGLQRLGHQVIAIANHAAGGWVEESYEGVQVFRFPFVSALTEGNLPKVKAILSKVSQAIAAFAPDVINTHALVGPLNFYQNRVRGARLCVTTHGGLIEAAHFQRAECAKLCAAAKVVSAPAAHFLETLCLSHSSTRVIPNGLPPALTPVQPLPEAPVIAMVGRLAPEKGFDTALRALKLLLPKYPHLKLLLVGDGPESASLSHLIHQLNLHTAVERVGVVPPHHVHRFIDRAQLVFIPSTHECLCLMALEAAMRGRPVVASRIPGLQESVEDGVTGFLVPPRDPQALAAQAGRLLSSPRLAEQMGRHALEKVTRQFPFERAVQNYLKMYEDAILMEETR